MPFLMSLCLVVIAAVACVVGVVGGVPSAFLLAAACSGAAVVIVWRRMSAQRDAGLKVDTPAKRDPQWNRPLVDLRDPDIENLGPLPTDTDIGIVGFDELVAAEVLPCLETLSIEQLEQVIRREKGGLNRTAVIERASRLIGLTTGEIKLDLRRDVIGATPERQRQALGDSALQKNSRDLSL